MKQTILKLRNSVSDMSILINIHCTLDIILYYRKIIYNFDWLKESEVSPNENEVSISGPRSNSTSPHFKISNDKIILSSKTVG